MEGESCEQAFVVFYSSETVEKEAKNIGELIDLSKGS